MGVSQPAVVVVVEEEEEEKEKEKEKEEEEEEEAPRPPRREGTVVVNSNRTERNSRGEVRACALSCDVTEADAADVNVLGFESVFVYLLLY